MQPVAKQGYSAFSYGNSSVGASAADDDVTSLAMAAGDMVINGVSVGAVAVNTVNGLMDAINDISSQTGVYADDVAGVGKLVLFNRTGDAINVEVFTADAATRSGFAQGETQVAAGDNGAIVLTGALSATTVTTGNNGTLQGITGQTGASSDTLAATSLASINVNTASASNMTLLVVDAALDTLNSMRSTLGSVQNRLESTISSLGSTSDNLSASRSRIQDADFAAETAKLTKSQVLQQAGISVLSQANAIPQNVMSLLR